jgi:hypothetical protein
MSIRPASRAGLCVGALLASQAIAGTVSPVQSDATTVHELDAIAPVMLAGSDRASRLFRDEDMAKLIAIVNANLSERSAVEDVADFALDPNPLRLVDAADVRVYFLGEGAGFRNSFGFYTGRSDVGVAGSDDAALVFPDASSAGSGFEAGTRRSPAAPLAAGDFVELGSFAPDTQLNLFLVANGANGGDDTWYTDPLLNADGLVHYVALATPGSPYLLVGIEDLPGGGDGDYNDLVVAVDIGSRNVGEMIAASGSTAERTVTSAAIAAVPLPAPLWALVGVAGLTALRRCRARS